MALPAIGVGRDVVDNHAISGEGRRATAAATCCHRDAIECGQKKLGQTRRCAHAQTGRCAVGLGFNQQDGTAHPGLQSGHTVGQGTQHLRERRAPGQLFEHLRAQLFLRLLAGLPAGVGRGVHPIFLS